MKTTTKLYRVVSEYWGDPVEVTLREFRATCRQLGWTVPRLVEGPRGEMRVRWYNGEDHLRVWDGDPEFDSATWLASGANWETVLEPVTNA